MNLVQNFIKNSFLYDIYFRLRYVKQSRKEINEEVDFYSSFLCESDLVFDIGANHGNKTEVFLKIARKVIAFEPDKSNLNFLKLRFKRAQNLTISSFAISDKIGNSTFFVVNHGSGLNTINSLRANQLSICSNYIVPTTTIDEMIDIYGIPSFIKIDVEGHELEVLKGLSFPVKIIVFEANLPQSAEQTLLSLDIIHKLKNNYRYNYGLDLGLLNDQWLNIDDIKSFIRKTDIPYLNIYCKIF